MYLSISRLYQRKLLKELIKRFLVSPVPSPSPPPLPSPSLSFPPGFFHVNQPLQSRGSSSFSQPKKTEHSFQNEFPTNIRKCRQDELVFSKNGNINHVSLPSSSSFASPLFSSPEQVALPENVSFLDFKKDASFEDASIKLAVPAKQVSVSENHPFWSRNGDQHVRKRKRRCNTNNIERQEDELKKIGKMEENMIKMEKREESPMKMENEDEKPKQMEKGDDNLTQTKSQGNNLVVPPKEDGNTNVPMSFWSRLGSSLKRVTSMNRDDWVKNVVHWKAEIGNSLKHYWVGTKLLFTDLRISSRLLLKLGRGNNLSRRERQQLRRTTSDMLRLVPFAVIVIVPFMELLLPVLLKLFPSMLPSTFQNKAKEEKAQQRILNARRHYAKFLQDIVTEMATEIKTTRIGDVKKTAEDLDKFMNKVRTGGNVTNEEILGFAKLFNDEITLGNISRPRLISMCKYMGIKPFGTDSYLCYMLRSKLAWIKNDDKLIQSEGVDLLSTAELQTACRDRGILEALTEEEMRKQLKDWLDLSLNFSVPSSLLILSRAFTVSGKTKPEEAVQATLSSLSDEVIDVVSISSLAGEGVLEESERKLKFIKHEDELIKRAEETSEGSKPKSKNG